MQRFIAFLQKNMRQTVSICKFNSNFLNKEDRDLNNK